MTNYITGYRDPFWNDPRVDVPKLPPRPPGARTWQASSLRSDEEEFGGFGTWPAEIWPMPQLSDGRKPIITQKFYPDRARPHWGVDIVYRRKPGESTSKPAGTQSFYVPGGTPILATAAGRVAWQFNSKAHGGQLGIEHSKSPRVVTAYMHGVNPRVRKGDYVKKGQVIATVGDSPSVNDIRHVHYSVRYDGRGYKNNAKQIVDPEPYLRSASSIGVGGGVLGALFGVAIGGGAAWYALHLMEQRGVVKKGSVPSPSEVYKKLKRKLK